MSSQLRPHTVWNLRCPHEVDNTRMCVGVCGCVRTGFGAEYLENGYR